MKNYEILNTDGEVINVIVADEEFMQSQYPNANYRERVEIQTPLSKVISKQEFRFKFTTAEYAALLLAAKTDVEVQTWVETFALYKEVNLDDPYVIESVDMMIRKNILSGDRKDAILSGVGVPTGMP